MRMNRFAVPGISQFVVVLAFGAALVCIPTPGFATPIPILGSNLSTFAILGGGGVAIGGTGSVITGSVGACCVAVAVTGVIPTNFTISGGTVQPGTQALAQGELVAAMTALSNMGLGTPDSLLGANARAGRLFFCGGYGLDRNSNSRRPWRRQCVVGFRGRERAQHCKQLGCQRDQYRCRRRYLLGAADNFRVRESRFKLCVCRKYSRTNRHCCGYQRNRFVR